MKNWRKWIAIILVMALPITAFAGISFESHCNSHAQELNSSANQGFADHCADEIEVSREVIQNFQSDDCQCECDSHTACVSTAAVAITGFAKTSFANSGDRLIHYIPSRIVSLNLSAIFRPPINS